MGIEARDYTVNNSEVPKGPDLLRRRYNRAAIMPYTSNLDREGKPRLSFFSSLAVIAGEELHRAGIVKTLVVCGEATFGRGKKSTTQLMREKLIALGVPPADIETPPEECHYDNTAFQVQALASRQRYLELQDEPLLIIGWDFHGPRIFNYAKHYRLEAEFAPVEEILGRFVPQFNLDKYREVLRQFEQRERGPRALSKMGFHGQLPLMLVTDFLAGGSVNDLKLVRKSNGQQRLELLNTTGVERLKDFTTKQPGGGDAFKKRLRGSLANGAGIGGVAMIPLLPIIADGWNKYGVKGAIVATAVLAAGAAGFGGLTARWYYIDPLPSQENPQKVTEGSP